MCRKFLLLVLVAFGILAASCSPPPPYSVKSLPSGRAVKIAGVGQMRFSGGDQSLMVKYYSDVDFTKIAELKAEADEIFQSFQKDAEQAGLKSAIISANQMPHGMFSSTNGWNFVFTKQADGSWTRKD